MVKNKISAYWWDFLWRRVKKEKNIQMNIIIVKVLNSKKLYKLTVY